MKQEEYWKSFLLMEEKLTINGYVWQLEQKLLEAVKAGETEAAERLAGDICANLLPKGPDHLRQAKRLFLVLTTLVSRQAIDSGFSAAEAMALADYFMQQCDIQTLQDSLAVLQTRMLQTFTRIVRESLMITPRTELVKRVEAYIQEHISEPIAVEEMAREFGMCRNTLSGRFKQETGQLLSEYIMTRKIERGRLLVAGTDYSFSYISEYLGFSSQSHFQRCFKKILQETPGEYRKRHLSV